MIEQITHFDTVLLYAIQAIGPAWQSVALLVSGSFGSPYLPVVVLILALALIQKKRVALETAVIFLCSLGVVYGLKALINAPRPYTIDAGIFQYALEASSAMPSGHALVSVAVLGWIWRRHPRSWVLTSGVLLIILAVGLSRVYLGVHYPSQVFAGWLLGGLLLWFFSWLDRFLFRPRSNYIKRGR